MWGRGGDGLQKTKEHNKGELMKIPGYYFVSIKINVCMKVIWIGFTLLYDKANRQIYYKLIKTYPDFLAKAYS